MILHAPPRVVGRALVRALASAAASAPPPSSPSPPPRAARRYLSRPHRALEAIARGAVDDCFGGGGSGDPPPARARRREWAQLKGPCHYRFTGAFGLAKQLRRPPLEIAAALAERIAPSADDANAGGGTTAKGAAATAGVVAEATAREPGFVDVRLSDAWLAAEVRRTLAERADDDGTIRGAGGTDGDGGGGARVLLDFASPNVGKELHVGHMRSSVLGDTLARVLEFCGDRVTRVSHVGDFGLPAALVAAAQVDQDAGDAFVAQDRRPAAEALGRQYAAAKRRMDRDPSFVRTVRATLRRMHAAPDWPANGDGGGDEGGNGGDGGDGGDDAVAAAGGRRGRAAHAAWRSVCAASRAHHADVYARLGVHVVDRPESTYAPLLPGVARDLRRHGLAVEDDGALCVFPGGGEAAEEAAADGGRDPMLIQKSDGTYLYGTVDLATVRQRVQDDGFDRVIYVTDGAQKRHFRQVFDVARRAGWTRGAAGHEARLEHVTFGTVQGADGRKLSSRDGGTLPLSALLDRAAAAAHALVVRSGGSGAGAGGGAGSGSGAEPGARGPMDGAPLTDDEALVLAETLGVAACRYFDLAHHRERSYALALPCDDGAGDDAGDDGGSGSGNPKRAHAGPLDFSGNTAVYLMYAYARVHNLVQRAPPLPPPGTADASADRNDDADPGLHDDERALAVAVCRFAEAVEATAAHLQPNLLCEYLFGLATAFNSFYASCRVIGDPHERRRVELCAAVRARLRDGMDLLGVPALGRV